MSDLTKMFNFAQKDSSIPSLPKVRAASQDSNGNYNGASICNSKYGGKEPPIPYTNQTNNLATQKGFKGELLEIKLTLNLVCLACVLTLPSPLTFHPSSSWKPI